MPTEFSKPLLNRTVLATCSAKKMPALASGIEAMGGTPLPFTVAETQELEDTRLLDQAVASLNKYAWIIFTSAYGVSFFMRRLNALGIRISKKEMPKICAIGPATAAEVESAGFEVALIPRNFVAEGVVESMGEFLGGLSYIAGQRILIPRAKEAREIIPEALAKAGAIVDIAPCYQKVPAAPSAPLIDRIRNKRPDLIVFASSSGVRNLVDILGEPEGRTILSECTVAVLGPITAATVASFGKHAEILPEQNTIASLLEAISAYYSRIERVPL
jgi:uroporphyrinogen III methyltransferase/synthase